MKGEDMSARNQPVTATPDGATERVEPSAASLFQQLIRDWRESKGLSLSQAGKRAGITKAHLWDLEQGRAFNPTIETLVGLATAYDASLPYLARLAAWQLADKRADAARQGVTATVPGDKSREDS